MLLSGSPFPVSVGGGENGSNGDNIPPKETRYRCLGAAVSAVPERKQETSWRNLLSKMLKMFGAQLRVAGDLVFGGKVSCSISFKILNPQSQHYPRFR